MIACPICGSPLRFSQGYGHLHYIREDGVSIYAVSYYTNPTRTIVKMVDDSRRVLLQIKGLADFTRVRTALLLKG